MSEHSSAGAAQILQSKGYKNVRALLGGWSAWTASGGATETVNAASNTMNTPTMQTHIASPNPTVKEEDANKGATTGTVSATPIQPATATQATPIKSDAKTKTKRKHKSSKTGG